jgi:cardiolipin synthase
MTLANKVTIGRILLIPVFVVGLVYYRRSGEEWHRWLALTTFLTAALSDGLDGWIARRFHQRSQLGAMLDPLADKLLLLAALILLSRSGVPHLPALPLWLVATILSRDAILVLGLAVIQFTCGHVAVIPRLTGKAATFLQMVMVVLTLADAWPSARNALALVTLVVTVGSGLQYSRDGLLQLGANPKSGPDSPKPSP